MKNYKFLHNARLLFILKLPKRVVCKEREKERGKQNVIIVRLSSSLEPCGHTSCLDMDVVFKIKTYIIYVTAAIINVHGILILNMETTEGCLLFTFTQSSAGARLRQAPL
jgi:hypothetical protein